MSTGACETSLEPGNGFGSKAEGFINAIGAEKVVSVAEEAAPVFGITVWYREECEAETRHAKPVMNEF